MRGLLGDGPVSTPRIRDSETPTAAPPPPSDTIAKRLSVGGGMARRISGAVGVCPGFLSYNLKCNTPMYWVRAMKTLLKKHQKFTSELVSFIFQIPKYRIVVIPLVDAA